jgi:hypothetical protein
MEHKTGGRNRRAKPDRARGPGQAGQEGGPARLASGLMLTVKEK